MSSVIETTNATPNEELKCVFEKPESLVDKPVHYCPGCSHGTYHRLIAEMIDEFGQIGRAHV